MYVPRLWQKIKGYEIHKVCAKLGKRREALLSFYGIEPEASMVALNQIENKHLSGAEASEVKECRKIYALRQEKRSVSGIMEEMIKEFEDI